MSAHRQLSEHTQQNIITQRKHRVYETGRNYRL
jgi:hypothetical protein